MIIYLKIYIYIIKMSDIILNISKVKYKFPTDTNHPKNFNIDDVEKWSKNSYPVTIEYNKINNLLKSFIKYKREYGSIIEKEYYKDIHCIDLLNRLIKNRPLVFMGRGDKWVLTDGNAGFGGWTNIGKNNNLHSLEDYMSYDEIELAVFISMSIYTPFINNGSRHNCGKITDNHEYEGIYIAQVGARFEERFFMEWKYMIVDPEQNTKENGYGMGNTNDRLKMWCDFYEIDYFPLYTDINGEDDRFKHIYGNNFIYLDTYIYKKRMKINALVFLKEANDRAKQLGNKKAFCHIVGLGLGVWKISDLQTDLFIEAHLELLNQYNFIYIDTLYFSWMNYSKPLDNYNNINIKFGKREPADLLNNDNLLL